MKRLTWAVLAAVNAIVPAPAAAQDTCPPIIVITDYYTSTVFASPPPTGDVADTGDATTVTRTHTNTVTVAGSQEPTPGSLSFAGTSGVGQPTDDVTSSTTSSVAARPSDSGSSEPRVIVVVTSTIPNTAIETIGLEDADSLAVRGTSLPPPTLVQDTDLTMAGSLQATGSLRKGLLVLVDSIIATCPGATLVTTTSIATVTAALNPTSSSYAATSTSTSSSSPSYSSNSATVSSIDRSKSKTVSSSIPLTPLVTTSTTSSRSITDVISLSPIPGNSSSTTSSYRHGTKSGKSRHESSRLSSGSAPSSIATFDSTSSLGLGGNFTSSSAGSPMNATTRTTEHQSKKSRTLTTRFISLKTSTVLSRHTTRLPRPAGTATAPGAESTINSSHGRNLTNSTASGSVITRTNQGTTSLSSPFPLVTPIAGGNSSLLPPFNLSTVFTPTSACSEFPCAFDIPPSSLAIPSVVSLPVFTTTVCQDICGFPWATTISTQLPNSTVSILSFFPALVTVANDQSPITAPPLLGPGSTNIMVPSPWSECPPKHSTFAEDGKCGSKNGYRCPEPQCCGPHGKCSVARVTIIAEKAASSVMEGVFEACAAPAEEDDDDDHSIPVIIWWGGGFGFGFGIRFRWPKSPGCPWWKKILDLCDTDPGGCWGSDCPPDEGTRLHGEVGELCDDDLEECEPPNFPRSTSTSTGDCETTYSATDKAYYCSIGTPPQLATDCTKTVSHTRARCTPVQASKTTIWDKSRTGQKSSTEEVSLTGKKSSKGEESLKGKKSSTREKSSSGETSSKGEKSLKEEKSITDDELSTAGGSSRGDRSLTGSRSLAVPQVAL
ncbi:hypothetical protein LTR37_001703 [Vermiconidia calcicola]|uniref:Uncharacterized protein n=1 Tax=Vermiconidia calcicola TaxID=1690605 RepID=A0ACC3NUI4_9PEZI|nr:hypothetical protein LTR37_001703 [Vermiconidia calcicola]